MLSLLILFLLVLILFSAFLSGSETALFSLSSFTVKSYKHDSDTRKKLIHHLLQNPRELLVTIMMLNIVANVLVQNTVSSLFGDFSSWALNVGVPLVLTLFLGEIIPKSLALPNNAWVSYRVAPIIAFLARVFGPLRTRLTHLTSYISRFLFPFFRKDREISSDELEHALKASRAKGVMNSDEAEIFSGYLDLQDALVKELMRPREEILYYDIEDPLSKLLSIFTEQECSRVPVCEGSLDNLMGMISTRRYFFYSERLETAKDLKRILKKPFFIPETTKALNLLRQLREKKESIAMVVDEYGSISGLITQEDLIEAVVGEISDRRDIKNRYTRSGEDVIIASGKLELKEIEDLFDVTLKSETNAVTIGGWLTEQMGDIPQAGTKYVTDDLLFYVLASDPNRVRRVYIRFLRPKKLKG
jgi:putative hemolysin